jgi:hypothetical protein
MVPLSMIDMPMPGRLPERWKMVRAVGGTPPPAPSGDDLPSESMADSDAPVALYIKVTLRFLSRNDNRQNNFANCRAAPLNS